MMKLMKNSYLSGSLLLLSVFALTGGCGYKTNPVPPQTVVPKAIEDLRYSLDDKGAKLHWSYPTETVNDRTLPEITSFAIYRAEIPLADFCGNCPIPFGRPIELPGGATGGETRSTVEYDSGSLRSGYKYFFKVTSRSSWLAVSADSNIVTFVYHTPASAPQSVKSMVGKNQVTLSWSPVTTLIDGSVAQLPMSYEVLRSSDSGPYVTIGTVRSGTTYVDKQVEAGKTYLYKVRSNMLYKDERLAGSLSENTTAKVLDTQPPEKVTGVTVIASAKNLRVFWDGSNEDDLSGYRIYRRLDGEQKSVRVGEVGRAQTLFIDADVPADTKVHYSVSAFDRQNNEGKPSNEATTRH